MIKAFNTKAILSRYYRYSEYNNNLDYLLEEIYKFKVFDYEKKDFLKDEVYEKCHEGFLLLLFAFKEKLHTKTERKMIKKMGKKDTLNSLRKAFRGGDYKYIKCYIDDIKE